MSRVIPPGNAGAPEGYITIREAATRIRAEGQSVSEQRLYDLAADGRMPCERFGRHGYRVFIPEAAFGRWRLEQPNAISQRRRRAPKAPLAPDVAAQEHERRVQLGRIGGYTAHARHDSREMSRAGHLAFMSRFEREVDPHGVLPPAERARRVEAAQKAYFTKLAYRRNYGAEKNGANTNANTGTSSKQKAS